MSTTTGTCARYAARRARPRRPATASRCSSWVAAASAALILLSVPVSAHGAGSPPYSVPVRTLGANLHCPKTFPHTKHEPVLLVHGTFVNGRVNYSWTYLPALNKLGFDVCYVDLPNGAMDDIQISTEYVVYGIRAIAAKTHRKVDVLGVSQGGLEERWAVKWWPDVQKQVDDVVMHASPNHGTLGQPPSQFSHCFASCWQMGAGSNFLKVLNNGDETPGSISYTSVFTNFDELVEPQLPDSTSALKGASNIRIQDLCPGRPVDHLTITSSDAVAFALAVDAFTHPGPANPKRFDTANCMKASMDGSDPQTGFAAFTDYMQHPPSYKDATAEPKLKPYAR